MLIPVASVIAFKEIHGRVILYLSLSGSLSSCSVCLGLCSNAEGQMCVRKKSLQQRWQAPFKLNCLNLKFIICKLLSGLASCYMERVWKKCQRFLFFGWSAAMCLYCCLVFVLALLGSEKWGHSQKFAPRSLLYLNASAHWQFSFVFFFLPRPLRTALLLLLNFF